MAQKDNQEDSTLKADHPPQLKQTAESLRPGSIELVSHDEPNQSMAQSATKPPKAQDKLLGTIIENRFEILSRIGLGSTTAVYRAQDKRANCLVAVKILRSEFTTSEYTVQRFQQECRTLELLKHYNIVDYVTSGLIDNEQPYLVMEYLEGTTLQELLESQNSVDIPRALRIFIQACAALTAAHEKNVIHRDLKPANIMLTTNGKGEEVAKILDFGVSKLLPIQGETFQTRTQTGEMLGTLLYMSPEQCLDHDLDGRSDVYSLGCVMFEALTGAPPLTARTAFETMNKHLTQMPETLSVVRPDLQWSHELEAIIQMTMAKNPNERYANARALQKDLSSLLSGKEKVEAIASSNLGAFAGTAKFYKAIKEPDYEMLVHLGDYAQGAFDRLDTNADGYMSYQELQAALNRHELSLRARSFVSYMLTNFDEIREAHDEKRLHDYGISRADLRVYCYKQDANQVVPDKYTMLATAHLRTPERERDAVHVAEQLQNEQGLSDLQVAAMFVLLGLILAPLIFSFVPAFVVQAVWLIVALAWIHHNRKTEK